MKTEEEKAGVAEKELGIREKDASLIRKALEERIIGGENR